MHSHPYDDLNPDTILDAIESLGMLTSGRMMPLNSYENRVYDISLDDGSRVIAKFYRPHRWRDDAILEEHAFCFELADADIPVVTPLRFDNKTLHHLGAHRFTLFPVKAGRAPEIDYQDTLKILGHFVGRLHAVGSTKAFQHRPAIDLQSYGTEPLAFLLENDWLPIDIKQSYESAANTVLEHVAQCFERCSELKTLRIHADLHGGNILMNEDAPHIVDLDDCRTGPAIQDIWMFLSGERSHMQLQLDHFLEGYREFYTFNPQELHLIEALRSLRMLHYSAWLAKRWGDPAFKQHFPWFNTTRYWEEQTLFLKEQIALLQEPPIRLLS